jgi:subtilisin-like proprotein convertase family protein
MNSDAYFHYASIMQVQANMAGKTCPTITNNTNNTPVANAGLDYIIPISTPFILTGSATDADADALTYCWEQMDDGAGQTNASSAASAGKLTGPNWRSYTPSSSPSRYMPLLSRVIANQLFTAGSEINVEYLSSVSRTLNFSLTVRDNAGIESQTHTDNMIVTTTAAAGPFTVSAPNTGVTWQAGTNQTVTWNVAGTTANGVNAAFVDIYLSNDGGNTYPILLASKVPNDGSEVILVPNTTGTTNRVMVKGWNHIFYDISNANFTISAPSSTFGVSFNGVSGEQNKDACQGSPVTYTFPYSTFSGFSGSTSFTVFGQPAGSTVTFTPTSTTTAGSITMQVTNTGGSAIGFYSMVVTGTSGATTKTAPFYLNLISGNFGTQNLTSPADLAVGQSTSVNLSWPVNAAATLYDVEVATDAGFSSIIASVTVATNSYTVTGLSEGVNYFWRVKPKNSGCSGTFSASYRFTTGTSSCGNVYSNNTPLAVPDGTGAGIYGATVSKNIVVPGSLVGSINSLTVDLAFTHPYIDDLQVWITHPDGTAVYLWNHNCEDEFSSVSVTFADGNPSIPLSPGCTASTGTFAPNTPLSALAGKPAAGTWVLRARDYWNPDTGSIGNWSLNLCVATPLVSESFNSIADLAIYPNPNNGNFTVQFNSTSNKDVKIGIHDVRGRQIFDKTYQNNGLFNQLLNLNNVQSGVYFVTVQDGARKTTKKIVVE